VRIDLGLHVGGIHVHALHPQTRMSRIAITIIRHIWYKRGYGCIVSVLVVTKYAFDSYRGGERKVQPRYCSREDSLSMIFKYAIDAGLSGYSSKKLTP
jgi:hypothetical protein